MAPLLGLTAWLSAAGAPPLSSPVATCPQPLHGLAEYRCGLLPPQGEGGRAHHQASSRRACWNWDQRRLTPSSTDVQLGPRSTLPCLLTGCSRAARQTWPGTQTSTSCPLMLLPGECCGASSRVQVPASGSAADQALCPNPNQLDLQPPQQRHLPCIQQARCHHALAADGELSRVFTACFHTGCSCACPTCPIATSNATPTRLLYAVLLLGRHHQRRTGFW